MIAAHLIKRNADYKRVKGKVTFHNKYNIIVVLFRNKVVYNISIEKTTFRIMRVKETNKLLDREELFMNLK